METDLKETLDAVQRVYDMFTGIDSRRLNETLRKVEKICEKLKAVDDLTSTIMRFKELEEKIKTVTEMLPLETAAEYLSLPVKKLKSLIKDHEISYYKYGDAYIYFSRKDLDEFMQRNQIYSNKYIRNKALVMLSDVKKTDRQKR
jgi:excisionase family DNA binding protein